MKSPFPGMDPHLEAHWRDVHARLIFYACDQLEPQLPPALISAIGNHHSLLPEHLSQPIVACVHAADVCAKVALSSEGAEIAPEVLHALRLTPDNFFDLAAELRNRRPQIDSFLT